MKLHLEFDTSGEGLYAVEMASLFIHLQNVISTLVLADEWDIRPGPGLLPVNKSTDFLASWSNTRRMRPYELDEYLFKALSPDTRCLVNVLSKSSPLMMELLLKASSWVGGQLQAIFDFVIYNGEERSRRAGEAAEKWEDVRAKRLDSLEKALDIAAKVPEQYRQEYLDKLFASITLLEFNPAQMRAAQVGEENPGEMATMWEANKRRTL